MCAGSVFSRHTHVPCHTRQWRAGCAPRLTLLLGDPALGHDQVRPTEESFASYLPTFLVQLRQLLLVLDPQLGHFLQLTLTPCSIMARTGPQTKRVKKREQRIRPQALWVREWGRNFRISNVDIRNLVGKLVAHY